MENLGTEVGQKMRCAVKAKLLELGTGGSSGYIDDELPDYVMIMVANKRSKEQMTEDLNLFLGSNTDIFVNWLHQVLQKLQEVTLPSTLLQKSKRKSIEASDIIPIKKDKKDKKKEKKLKRFQKETTPENILAVTSLRPHSLILPVPSITDVFADQLIQKAKRSLEIERNVKSKVEKLDQSSSIFNAPNDDFDIPTITEIAENAVEEVVRRKELSELEELQKKINLAKRQLRAMTSEESEDEDFLNIKADGEEFEEGEHLEEEDKIRKSTGRNPSPLLQREEKRKHDEMPSVQAISNKSQRIPIIYNENASAEEKSIRLKRSILERIGSRTNAKDNDNIISLSVHRKVETEVFIPSFRRKELEKEIQNDSAKLREKEKQIEKRKLFERNKSIIVKPKVSTRLSVKHRIGSRVIVPPPKPEFDDDKVEVPVNSIVKIKPRPLIPLSKQANKNLLLKAVAEAQKSTSYIPLKRDFLKTVSSHAKNEKPKNRIFRDLLKADTHKAKTIVIEVKSKNNYNNSVDILNTTSINEDECTPEPVANQSDSETENIIYVPKLVNNDEHLDKDVNFNMSDCGNLKHQINKKNPQFVVTLDGVYKNLNNNQAQSEKVNNQNTNKKITVTNASIVENPKLLTKIQKKTNTKDKSNTKPNVLKYNPNIINQKTIKNELKEIKCRLSTINQPASRQQRLSPINFNINKTVQKKETNIITKNIKIIENKTKEKDNTLVIKKTDLCKKYENLPALLSTVNLPVEVSTKSKLKERCKYFPNCRQGEACEFIHPNSLCKAFPNCLYSINCLYLHPKCKFDMTCTRLDCNYSHTPTSSSAPPLASHVVPVQNYISITANQLPPMCKYYPGCSNSLCTFYHPKLCRFGKNCLNKVECNFYHYELPTKDKLKWVSASNI